jgi:hypothetical protein
MQQTVLPVNQYFPLFPVFHFLGLYPYKCIYIRTFCTCSSSSAKEENVVKWIKGQRISWLGYLEKMEEDRRPKKIFIQELEGMRQRGRPRRGWKEEVERDLQVLGVRRWRELVTDRKKWNDIV